MNTELKIDLSLLSPNEKQSFVGFEQIGLASMLSLDRARQFAFRAVLDLREHTREQRREHALSGEPERVNAIFADGRFLAVGQ
jgi:hypothetical protein